jgi:hypothetical protein
MLIFAPSRFVRAVMPDLKGNFYFCPKDRRCYPDRDLPKGIQSPDEGLDTVKGNAVSLLSMSKTSLQ